MRKQDFHSAQIARHLKDCPPDRDPRRVGDLLQRTKTSNGPSFVENRQFNCLGHHLLDGLDSAAPFCIGAAQTTLRKWRSRFLILGEHLGAVPKFCRQIRPQPVSTSQKLLDVELLLQRREVSDSLGPLRIWSSPVPAHQMAKQPAARAAELCLGHAVTETKDDAFV